MRRPRDRARPAFAVGGRRRRRRVPDLEAARVRPRAGDHRLPALSRYLLRCRDAPGQRRAVSRRTPTPPRPTGRATSIARMRSKASEPAASRTRSRPHRGRQAHPPRRSSTRSTGRRGRSERTGADRRWRTRARCRSIERHDRRWCRRKLGHLERHCIPRRSGGALTVAALPKTVNDTLGCGLSDAPERIRTSDLRFPGRRRWVRRLTPFRSGTFDQRSVGARTAATTQATA
jgi:hypothetical protein